ncbi:glycosyltransferase [uncultured Pontibacter sp.]|uniref:glycosyltransferase n=1 Tax=uncultured Pontibacter sp. TaxID=453356 RepID=UPI002628521C|nr:glycosyltransferase [uncultured Pontibacter sp.]
MSEKRIVIASLLKPVNDTRMYEKLGLSLSHVTGTEVHICGYAAPVPDSAPANIFFHPLFNFKRLSLGRVAAQLKFFRLLVSLKPQVVIACTHELLLASNLYCRKYKAKLVYDVQENYTLNLRKQHNYNGALKRLLSFGVGSIEKAVAPAVSHFILAERSYAQELPFLQHRYTILENKYKKHVGYQTPATPVNLKDQPLRLLYSGTIAAEYGIFDAIELADKFYTLKPDTTLTIIGYCANKDTWQKVQQQTAGKKYITVTGGEKLVPHARIIEEMARCNVGLLPYQPNESTFRCMPTKLYEYMAHALPLLITYNPIWQDVVQQHQSGISVDFSNIHAPALLQQLQQSSFYTLGIPQTIFWEQEESVLQSIVKKALELNHPAK